MGQDSASSVRAALQPSALRAALVPRRPVFGNPWDSAGDMFACYLAVSVIDPLLLWAGGELTSWIFGYDSQWPLGVFMDAALVGAAGFHHNHRARAYEPLGRRLGHRRVGAPWSGRRACHWLGSPKRGSDGLLRGPAAAHPRLRASHRSLGDGVSSYRELAGDMELAGPAGRPQRAPVGLLSVARGQPPTPNASERCSNRSTLACASAWLRNSGAAWSLRRQPPSPQCCRPHHGHKRSGWRAGLIDRPRRGSRDAVSASQRAPCRKAETSDRPHPGGHEGVSRSRRRRS
jgi:hypothetical protein